MRAFVAVGVVCFLAACPGAQSSAPTCIAKIVVHQPDPKPLASAGDAAHVVITHDGAVVFDDPFVDLVGKGKTGGDVTALDAHGPTAVPAGKNFALALTIYDSTSSTIVANGRATFDCAKDGADVDVPLYLGPANAFAPTAAPPSTFTNVVALLDGRVLALGNGAALFDPTSSTWTSVGSSSNIEHFTASRFPDGNVVIVGDRAISLFDPTHDTFTAIATLDVSRERHVAVAVDDLVFVAGGIDTDSGQALADTFFVDETGTITLTSSLAQARENAVAVLLQSRDVFIAGGDDGTNPLDSFELYEVDHDAFRAPEFGCSVGPGSNGLCAKRTGASAIALDDGNVLIVGGTTVDEDADHPAQSAEVFLFDAQTTKFASEHDDDVTGFRSMARITCSSPPCDTLIVGAQPHRTFTIASADHPGTLHVYGGTFSDATRALDQVPDDAQLVALNDGTVLAVGATSAARFTPCEASANLTCPPL